jgi:hypothetical protein
VASGKNGRVISGPNCHFRRTFGRGKVTKSKPYPNFKWVYGPIKTSGGKSSMGW